MITQPPLSPTLVLAFSIWKCELIVTKGEEMSEVSESDIGGGSFGDDDHDEELLEVCLALVYGGAKACFPDQLLPYPAS